jgi:hypothetical protein
MTYNYPASRKQAQRIISKFGAPGSVVKKGEPGGGFDVNGDPVAASPDVTLFGTVTPLVRFKTGEIDGTTILKGDSWVFFNSETSPEIDMQITLNFETFRIVDLEKLTSVDDINVFRRLTLRK